MYVPSHTHTHTHTYTHIHGVFTHTRRETTDAAIGCSRPQRNSHRDYCIAAASSLLRRPWEGSSKGNVGVIVKQAVEQRVITHLHYASRRKPGCTTVHGACLHSLPRIGFTTFVCSAYGPSPDASWPLSIMLLVPVCTHCLISALLPVDMLCIWALTQALCMLCMWVLALINDVSSDCQHSLLHISLTACVCSAYGPSSPLNAQHMGFGPRRPAPPGTPGRIKPYIRKLLRNVCPRPSSLT